MSRAMCMLLRCRTILSSQNPEKRRAASGCLPIQTEMAGSTAPKDIAELQWRALLPLSTGLMALVSAVIGIGRPRMSMFPRLIGAVGAYAAVFNVAALARTLVEKGTVGAFPGLWWSLLVPIGLFGGLWLWRRRA